MAKGPVETKNDTIQKKGPVGKPSPKKPKKSYFNINRLQYRSTIGSGQSALQQSSFINFSNGFFLVESFEWVAKKDDHPSLDFEFHNFETSFGYSLRKLNRYGKVFNINGRIQTGDNQETIFSAGLHWDIHKTDAFQSLARKWRATTFLQIYPIKSDYDEGGVDLYYWLQLKGFSKWCYIRGAVSYYLLPGGSDMFYTFWDLITPVNDHLDIYLRYSHRNKEAFNMSNGSFLYLGMRVNFKL